MGNGGYLSEKHIGLAYLLRAMPSRFASEETTILPSRKDLQGRFGVVRPIASIVAGSESGRVEG